ncbi:hypothetical protein LSH36_138g08013 [Paralvinella palmiformis]|uniref:Myosin motor domain-containing protein n=1 Tax=Paralvinella palmiformis TaxID=53620 RepID=A0AAD9JWX5_9ANNE|nr:hypothetical protein LSH36_138g08013 [Paralvinella palmiformis]
MENPEMINDLATLVKLDEPQLLDAIKIRFSKDKIYTYIGDILIAVNPYKDLPQYGAEVDTSCWITLLMAYKYLVMIWNTAYEQTATASSSHMIHLGKNCRLSSYLESILF